MALIFSDIWPSWPQLLLGLSTTLWMSATAIGLGSLIGVVGAIMRASPSRPLRLIAGTYVEVLRNTPFLVQLFLVFFGLPSLGMTITSTQAAVIALVLNLGAYTTEIIRAGIDATHRSQIEAAASLGLTRGQILRDVVLLPSLDRVWPALSSQFVLIMLASSIVSQIGVAEISSAAALIESRTYRSTEIYLVSAGLYLALTLLFRSALRAVGFWLFPHRRASRAPR